ncbi:DUF1735 domain-containing protein [Niabella sp. CC-SYL272]|uniref:DUF1735 domain-containing protein n=1 Tax=Niabella agricola TaxID=2891571 RepID=UPI001F3DB783|nr:DUF1735 domain-containing protein [Niabella agricola]MCF3111863.1 DUF1735 domain-containing protein [Niabella agricola]
MKSIKMKKIFSALALSFVLVGFSSCLKDDSAILKPEQTTSVVELGTFQAFTSSSSNPIRLYSLSFDLSPLDTIIIPVNYAGGRLAQKDIPVKVVYDSSIVKTFNEKEYGTTVGSYKTALKPDALTVGNAVIKKGSNTTELAIAIKVNQIAFDKSYVVPLVISDASGETISGNFSKIVINVSVKNRYDGQFTANGTYSDLTLGAAATARYPKTINLITQSPNSVAYFDINLNGGTYGYTFFNNGGGSFYGNFAPVFVFDDNGAVSSVINYYGQGTNSSARSAEIDPTGINRMTFGLDGKPQKLEVSYFMYQSGAKRLIISETLTFQHAR